LITVKRVAQYLLLSRLNWFRLAEEHLFKIKPLEAIFELAAQKREERMPRRKERELKLPAQTVGGVAGYLPVKEGMLFLLIRGGSYPENPLSSDFSDF
jgi:hypothetical protein